MDEQCQNDLEVLGTSGALMLMTIPFFVNYSIPYSPACISFVVVVLVFFVVFFCIL